MKTNRQIKRDERARQKELRRQKQDRWKHQKEYSVTSDPKLTRRITCRADIERLQREQITSVKSLEDFDRAIKNLDAEALRRYQMLDAPLIITLPRKIPRAE